MKQRSGFTVMAKLVGLVRPLAGFMALAITMGLIGNLCATFITISGGWAVLHVLELPAPLSLGWIFGAVCLMALVRGVLRYAEQACNHYIAFRLLALIRDRVFGALRKLCPAKLEGRDRGDLIAVITADIELLEVFYAHTISPAAIALLFCTVMCLFLASFHPLQALVALVAYLTVGVGIPLVVSRLSGDAGQKFRGQSGELSAFVLDSLRGLPEIQQYGQGKARLAEMNRRTEVLSGQEERMKRSAGRNGALTGAVMLAFDLIMLAVSATLYFQGQVAFEGVLIPVIALFSSFGPCAALAGLGSTLQNTFAAGNRVLDILEDTPLVEERAGEAETSFAGAEVRDVTFSYEGEPVLEDVSLTIPKGEVVGITGRSGSGKSTLLKLLMRFWDVRQGEVRISGRQIDRVNTADLRNMESFVTQETHLFRDSIRANLKIARLDATQEEIEEACRKASVHDFILTLSQGYDTPVGELGDTLSGGERQRLGLARAFLHDAPLMLLDEPTSNLDSLNEAVILRSLHQEREGKTVVLVSHRASTMRIADRVVSVERGRMS